MWGNVVRDLAAAKGVELLPWDGWGPQFLGRVPLSEQQLAAADAAGSRDDPVFRPPSAPPA
ncbi:hypothetical protein [Streptomyces sp. DH10]|uniref:hypothetical protein n=1 Tax=Streptomyces sp. DH10 TaxID=3040121 RepID=UPI002443311C|nr:hypothetical protein [Streptomyces sp. DH10]MDG9709215.1 hypothetical protein [Streptomyces sp. DH10]